MNLDERLIIEVQQYPGLYDQTSPDYRDLRKKETMWQAVADSLGLHGKPAAARPSPPRPVPPSPFPASASFAPCLSLHAITPPPPPNAVNGRSVHLTPRRGSAPRACRASPRARRRQARLAVWRHPPLHTHAHTHTQRQPRLVVVPQWCRVCVRRGGGGGSAAPRRPPRDPPRRADQCTAPRRKEGLSPRRHPAHNVFCGGFTRGTPATSAS